MSARSPPVTQDEVALLLGGANGTRIGRHERFDRLPLTTTIFAYEIVFQAPARELFAGLYNRMERQTIRQAISLSKTLSKQTAAARTTQKIESLKAIYVPFTENHENTGTRR